MKVAMMTLVMMLTGTALAEPKYGEIVMTGPDSATVTYEDKCSNGAILDDETADAFVQKVLNDPKSTLGQARAQVLKTIKNQYKPSVAVSAKATVYYDRDGCGAHQTSFVVFLTGETGDTSHRTVAYYMATFNDDDSSGVRTLKMTSLTPVKLRK